VCFGLKRSGHAILIFISFGEWVLKATWVWQEAEDTLGHRVFCLTALQAMVSFEGFCVPLFWVELSRHRQFNDALSGVFCSGMGLGSVLSHAFF